MTDLKLYITNKNYSSWSLRAWIALKVKDITFEEVLSLYDEAGDNLHFYEFSPSKKVPVLVHGQTSIWESLAILEYLAELFPEKGFWPQNAAERAWARAISHEMHGGFMALRSECPMNIRREVRGIQVSEDVKKDVQRIKRIWSECLDHSGGPFLFGSFINADAMYAPLINRLEKYALSDDTVVQSYSAAIKALPAWQEWEAAALAEPWRIEEDEA